MNQRQGLTTLRQVRRASGLTLVKCKQHFGVHLATWCRWETGEVMPPPQKLRELSAFFNVTVGQLLGTEPLPAQAA